MNGIQSYQFEPEGTLEDEDDSDCFEKKGNHQRSAEENRCPVTLTGVYMNYVYSGPDFSLSRLRIWLPVQL